MSAALHPVASRRGERAVVVTLQLSWPEVTALCDQTFLVETLGLRVAGTVAASTSGDVATVLHTASYKLYLGLREAMAWGMR